MNERENMNMKKTNLMKMGLVVLVTLLTACNSSASTDTNNEMVKSDVVENTEGTENTEELLDNVVVESNESALDESDRMLCKETLGLTDEEIDELTKEEAYALLDAYFASLISTEENNISGREYSPGEKEFYNDVLGLSDEYLNGISDEEYYQIREEWFVSFMDEEQYEDYFE